MDGGLVHDKAGSLGYGRECVSTASLGRESEREEKSTKYEPSPEHSFFLRNFRSTLPSLDLKGMDRGVKDKEDGLRRTWAEYKVLTDRWRLPKRASSSVEGCEVWIWFLFFPNSTLRDIALREQSEPDLISRGKGESAREQEEFRGERANDSLFRNISKRRCKFRHSELVNRC